MLLAFLLLSVSQAKAQLNILFSSDNDLPNTLINKICADKKQMMWIATENALCKYNGSRFITYRNKKGDPNSLANNFVRTVCVDNSGNVAVGTIDGVQIYRPLTDDFTPRFSSHEENIHATNANDITLLHDGSFLVLGSDCYTLVNENGEWHAHSNVLTKNIHNVFRAIELKDGSFLVARQPTELLHVLKNGKVNRIQRVQGSNFNIAAFCQMANGMVYAGSADAGVYLYSPKSEKLELVRGTENLDQVCDIEEIPGTSILAIATDGMGLRFYDTKKGEFVNLSLFSNPLVNINSQKAHTIFISDEGDMWVGLYQKGILLSAHSNTAFAYIGSRSQQNNLIGDCCVTSLLQSHDGNIWATTDNGGLFGFTPDFRSLHKYLADDSRNGIPATMMGLFEDSRHRVWYGSFGRGGGMVDLSTGLCKPVLIKGNSSRDFSVYSFVEDKRGQIWVATMGNGILRYDESQNEFVPYLSHDNVVWSDCIYYDAKADRIYCGTYNGISSFSPSDKTKKLTSFVTELIVYSISRISDDMLAFASNEGLVLLTMSTGETRILTTKDGLPNDNVCAVQMAGNNLLWISTMSGLTRFNLKTMTAETYTSHDGLQGNEFYKNASIITRDGRLWFGGINGITSFKPNDITQNRNNCKVRVVDVRAGETYLNADEDGEYVIQRGVEAFTVSFATIPLYMTHRVSYSYSLDGEKWELLAAPQNRITFSNLDFGSHVLRVKTTVDGIDSEVSETRIYVSYPWYLKWWMVIIWLILAFVAAHYISKFIRERRAQHERERLHSQEEELRESKLQFFMNVVHDLRTPLTLIATPLQKLQKTDTDDTRQHLYDIMHRNTQRLLRLTNEIMDLRKIDRGKMELNPQHAYVSKHINEIVKTMSDIAETHHDELVVNDHTNGDVIMKLDFVNLEKILTNLLSNALKYTPDGGHIEVEWDYQPCPERKNYSQLVLSVTDDGIGISADEKKQIFERFYQVRVNDKHVKGTGIGLNLVKALVELHKGKIEVTDNPAGKGTRFTVVLPNGESDKEAANAVVTEELEVTIPTDENVLLASPVVADAQRAHISKTHSTVLVVDDDDDIRNFLYEELSSVYNVLEAPNGNVAFEILNRQDVDLVVSDVMMPELDGIELTRMIRKNVRLSHLPIILLTAKASDQERIEGLQTTADAYVTKPFNLELLETLIGNLLMRHETLRNTFSGKELPMDKIETPELHSADDKLMERMMKIINDNLANPDLTSEMLAREVGLSRVHMYRKLKELTNQSATNYIRNIRLTKAAELLRQNKTSVSEVAYLVGFRTPAHFSTAFKELYGVSPKEYMNKE